jgi:nitrite reductase (NADH) small subunit
MTKSTVICNVQDLVSNSGVCVKIDDQQVALFYLPDESPKIYAIGNWDPIGKANVLSRGIVGDIGQRLVVASPLYKHHFDLQTGDCIEEPDIKVPVFDVTLVADEVILN